MKPLPSLYKNENIIRIFDEMNVKSTKIINYEVKENNILLSYAIEDNSAIEFIDEKFSKSITSGGNSYKISIENGNIVKEKL